MSLLGKTVLGVRITSVLFGTLGVLTTYLVYRQLFGPATAFLAATLLTTSLWSLMYSRVGLRHISLPPWIGLSAYCFWRGLQTPADRRRQMTGWFAAGGLCVGTMLYTYFASRVVPILYAAFTLYLLACHRRLLSGRWLGLTLFFILPGLIFVPMALYLRQHPELEQRLNQVGGELFVALRAGDLRPLLRAIAGTLKMFSLQGDQEWLYNISKRPVFDPITSIPFYFGVLTSLWRWRDPKRAFLLLWLAIGIAPAMLSWPPGSMGHTIVAQPAAFGFPALALVASWRWARGQRSRWARWSVGAFAAAVMLTFALHNGYDYFVRWPRFPQVRHEYQAPITAVARYLQDRSDLTPACISAPYVDHWNPWS
jgi:4-amino-4-deoxy-L-arabinose transferase-like glycosyltransferase